jgi:phage terminase small subunit
MNQKQIIFATEYMVDRNATQAAIRAGYSAKTAASQGERLLRHVEIAAFVRERTAFVCNAAGIETDKLHREIARIALSDPRKIMHADGRFKMPHELDDDTAAAIASFEVSIDGGIKYKFWDKNSAQERAAKILGLFERDNKQKTDPISELIKSIQGRGSIGQPGK